MPSYLPFRTCFNNYIYDSNMNSIITVSDELFKNLLDWKKNSEEICTNMQNVNLHNEINYLKSNGYLHRSMVTDLTHPQSEHLEQFLDRQLGMLILQLTQGCNFRCSYCVYSSSNKLNRSHSNKSMSFETAKRAIDFYHDRTIDSKEVGISFYGGEPLLQFELIKQIVEYCDSKFYGKTINYRITTNGSLLDTDTIKFFIDEGRNFNVLISLDGPKRIQDRFRRFSDGHGSYDKILENIYNIDSIYNKIERRFSFNTVIDTDMDYDEIVKLERDPILKKCSIQYNFVEKEDRYETYNSIFLEKINYDVFLGYLSYYRDQKEVYPNKLVEYIIHRDLLQQDRISSGMIGERAVPSGPCTPGVQRLFVDAVGNLFPCERVSELNENMKIGSIASGFNLESVIYHLNISRTTAKECRSCWAFQLCSLCVKASDRSGSFSSESRLAMCNHVKLNAMDLLSRITLHSENQQHEANIKKARVMEQEK